MYLQGACNESNDALVLILVLTVLQNELNNMKEM